jgi:hypothetical protein
MLAMHRKPPAEPGAAYRLVATSRRKRFAHASSAAVPNRHTAAHNFDGVSLTAETLNDPQIREALQLAAR